jgi:hypothetical protein
VVTIRGTAGATVRAAFEDVGLTVTGGATQLCLAGGDQAALHGLLQRVQDLGLEVLEVQRTAKS